MSFDLSVAMNGNLRFFCSVESHSGCVPLPTFWPLEWRVASDFAMAHADLATSEICQYKEWSVN